MVDVASLLFMVGGALSYPLFFHLSLKKSLSIASGEKVANGRILLSLISRDKDSGIDVGEKFRVVGG